MPSPKHKGPKSTKPPHTQTTPTKAKNPNPKDRDSDPPPYRQIRALSTATTITVYQAYSPSIATAAVATQSFSNVPGFKRERMTWIKPSFLWMAYRCGYATKKGQERVLAVEITRAGFEWALRHSCLSHTARGASAREVEEWREQMKGSPVRIQWDPERDIFFAPLGYRSLQVGLGPDAVQRYISEWIVSIRDVTGSMVRIQGLIEKGDLEGAWGEVPREEEYVLDEELRRVIGAS
ncbi:uncharacterized protein BJX67DRAFT_332191 [Aspergillus lucknowensis]|uniref:DUF4291 domain-containing protein n=1 Tax=Aspergillus lucknowensis TaxID=176173 RepID=A0ABR4LY58_9EURO